MAERTSRSAAVDPATAYPDERHVHHDAHGGTEHELWQGRTRVVLQPIAAPSILGLFGFAGATMMVGAWQAGWYGDANTGLILFPFAAAFGGLAQFIAGVWSYRARDGLATAMHGMWGCFWLAFGLLFGMDAAGALPSGVVPSFGTANPGFGFWFVVLTLITGAGAIASLGESLGLFTVLGSLTVGAGFTAASFMGGIGWLATAGGYAFAFSALAAVYVASAMMFEGTFGRTVLPLGKYTADANVPGRTLTRPLEYEHGQPGVKMGQ